MVAIWYKYRNLNLDEMERIEEEFVKEGTAKSISKYWEENMKTKFKEIYEALKKRSKKIKR